MTKMIAPDRPVRQGETRGKIDPLARGGAHLEVDAAVDGLSIDMTVAKDGGTARVAITREHAHVARIEVDRKLVGGDEDGGDAAGPRLRTPDLDCVCAVLWMIRC